jgi:uncharacterized membrane protein
MNDEARLYRDVYRVLLAGVVISNAFFVIGLVLRSQTWLEIATVLLIATPVLRVAIAIHAFYTERDWRFVVVSTIVLAVIGATIAASRLGLV